MKKRMLGFCLAFLLLISVCSLGWASKEWLWIKYDSNPIVGNTSTGTMFDPFVMMVGDEYWMYVSARDWGCGSIALCKSHDGIEWSDPVEVFGSTNNTGWEAQVNRACVLYRNGLYYMYYTGQQDGMSRIGIATSCNGEHFERLSDECILAPEFPWEGQSVMNPFVIYDEEENIYKMWYAAGETYEPDVICYATSSDGIHFTKHEKNPIFTHGEAYYDSAKVSIGHIEKTDNGNYLLFYIGYETVDDATICVAKSDNGIDNWKRFKHNPIVKPSHNSFDKYACYKASVIHDTANNRWLLWYNGRGDQGEFIGVVKHDGIFWGE